MGWVGAQIGGVSQGALVLHGRHSEGWPGVAGSCGWGRCLHRWEIYTHMFRESRKEKKIKAGLENIKVK